MKHFTLNISKLKAGLPRSAVVGAYSFPYYWGAGSSHMFNDNELMTVTAQFLSQEYEFEVSLYRQSSSIKELYELLSKQARLDELREDSKLLTPDGPTEWAINLEQELFGGLSPIAGSINALPRYAANQDITIVVEVRKDLPMVTEYGVVRRILAAAIDYSDGYALIVGARHSSPAMTSQTKALREEDEAGMMKRGKGVQGFIDQFDTFYTREEALALVRANGQPFDLKRNSSYVELYSEGVW